MNDSVPPPLPPTMPPQMPPAVPYVKPAPQKVKGISGHEGISTAELSDAVANGARLVVFQFCVSVLVMSFKRSSTIYLLKRGDSALAKGWPFCLISLFAGWWGIPWGPIWTVTTLSTNLGGGKDVTRQVLAGLRVPTPVILPAPK